MALGSTWVSVCFHVLSADMPDCLVYVCIDRVWLALAMCAMAHWGAVNAFSSSLLLCALYLFIAMVYLLPGIDRALPRQTFYVKNVKLC